MGVESYLDVNIFVYWLGKHPTFGEVARRWIKRVEEDPKRRYANFALTVYQTLVIIAGLTGRNLKEEKLVDEIIHSITDLAGLSIIPLTQKDMVQAVGLMKEYGLDYEDALHLAAALKSGAKEIISNDQDFDRTPLKRSFT
ncbi:MAG: type II toxin-antitoxin system VapC family toxin [Thaumarchaeota archaeon]|nr:type II toxin-antitoxin system VapC family toxin [Nitrososphaerota archaeon]